METWNACCICSQKQRFNHVAEIPNEMYKDQLLPRFGWCPDPKFLAQLKEAVKDVGKYLTPIISKLKILTFIFLDLDAFLSNDTTI